MSGDIVCGMTETRRGLACVERSVDEVSAETTPEVDLPVTAMGFVIVPEKAPNEGALGTPRGVLEDRGEYGVDPIPSTPNRPA